MGFLYTLVVRRPFESLITDVSRNGMLLSFSVSMVKRIVGCWLLRCCKKPSTWSRSNIVKVSSTYRFQILGTSCHYTGALNAHIRQESPRDGLLRYFLVKMAGYLNITERTQVFFFFFKQSEDIFLLF